MRKVLGLTLIIAAGIGILTLAACVRSGEWTSTFLMGPDELVSVGRNPYFILEPGYQLVLEGAGAQLIITVLNETKKVDGVETRVVEERETKNGQLTEVARNYFAISKRTNDVFYFGEDVDMYKDGKVVNHDGTWLSGMDGGKFGLMMPGRPLLKASYCQEVAPKVAMDRATIVSTSDTVETPAGELTNCLKVEETTPLQRLTEYKYYALGIGMVSDGTMKLVKAGKVPAAKTGGVPRFRRYRGYGVMRHGTSVPTPVTEAASRISLASSSRPTATVLGSTGIAAPLAIADPGASTELASSGPDVARGCGATTAPGSRAATHCRSNAAGLT